MSEEPLSPFERFLSTALEQTLNRLIEQGKVEVEEAHREPLHGELLRAASGAETPKKMLKQLVKTIAHSDHVEEIYPSDDELLDIFRDALEREG